MNPLLWVLAGIVAYWVAALWLERQGYLPEYVHLSGPITTLHTKRGRIFLERLARPKRFWRAWSNVGVGIALVLMVGSFVALVVSAVSSVTNPQPTVVNEPRNVLVIPGVNDFLPLSAAPEIVLGLLVGLVVHEGGHGLLCRVENIDIDSMGLALLAVVPIGAFVEPDEDSQRRADRGGKTRMFAAGVTNNFAITLLAFALLFGPVVGSIGVAQGAAVQAAFPDSPAQKAGIESGDRITAVDGVPIANNSALVDTLEGDDAGTVTVTIDGEREVSVERSVFVTAISPEGPVNVALGDTITEVNGQSVATQADFERAIAINDTEVTVRTASGNTSTFPVGAYVVVAEDSPLANASGLGGERAVVTAFGGERVRSQNDLGDALERTSPGDRVNVTLYHGGGFNQADTITVTMGSLSASGDDGYLGIYPQAGVSGVVVNDFGVRTYPAGAYLGLLGGDVGVDLPPIVDSFLGKVAIALFLPLAGAGVLPVPFNFAGFTPDIVNFYTAQGPLGFLDGGVFLLANSLFWIAWINIQLGFFNCIPAFPLDGGRILRTGTEAIVSRLPISADHQLTRTVTTSIGLTMLVSFLLMIFAPTLLAG